MQNVIRRPVSYTHLDVYKRQEPVHEVQEQEDTTESLEEKVFNESEAETESPIQQLEEMVPAPIFAVEPSKKRTCPDFTFPNSSVFFASVFAS